MTPNRMMTFARQNWVLLSGIAITLIVAVWFTTRLILDFLYFSDPNNVDVDLKPWMTPRFIVQTYDLPRPTVFEILQLDKDEDGGRRLGRIAEQSGLSMPELTEKVREGAAQYRAEKQ